MAQGYFAEALQVVAKRRDEGLGEDWFSKMIDRADDGEVAREDVLIASESLLLLNGGSDTTRHVIAGGMLALIERPDQYALLRQEPERLPDAIEEMIRWDTSVQISQRVGPETLDLGGVEVPGGQVCVIINGAANRDPAVFDQPDRLDVGRRAKAHFGFGMGRHFCLGSSLARLEVQTVISSLLRRFPNLELDVAEPVFRPSLFLRGLAALPLRW